MRAALVNMAFAALITTPCGAQRADAQRGSVPAQAKALVVSVRGYYAGSSTAELGAGIIVGTARESLYVATAKHVVRREGIPADSVWAFFPSGDSARATVAAYAKGLDVAVLSVPARAARAIPTSWDRRGAVRPLRSNDPLKPVGCPQGQCWQVSALADRLMWVDRLGILFQSSLVEVGSSGGALFNAWWEVVGMVTEVQPPRATALSIDDVLGYVATQRFPVDLERPPVPRGGYRTSVGVAIMTGTPGRVPSGRVTFVRQARPALSWQVTALRLAPENLAITAGMAGVGVPLRTGRFVVRPFIEAGFGQVEGRYDIGGYYVASPGGPRYVPFWNRVVGDGLGVGGGVTLEAIALPRTIVEVTTGYWSFTTPVNAPLARALFVGAGLRWGL
jgi:hypothetical protein